MLGPDSEAVELDQLLGYFYRLPRLPKLANADVLRNCLARGVADGIFGLVSGSAWYAPDAVRRFATTIDSSEIQFQPGTWLVRAAAIKQLIDDHSPDRPPGGGSEEPTEPETPLRTRQHTRSRQGRARTERRPNRRGRGGQPGPRRPRP